MGFRAGGLGLRVWDFGFTLGGLGLRVEWFGAFAEQRSDFRGVQAYGCSFSFGLRSGSDSLGIRGYRGFRGVWKVWDLLGNLNILVLLGLMNEVLGGKWV